MSDEEIDWKARAEKAEADLAEAYEESTTLERELRSVRQKLDRMHTRADQESRLMTLRTSALCALLELPDPRWKPTKEEMEP